MRHHVPKMLLTMLICLGVCSTAQASEVKVCNKGTIPLKGLWLSEVYGAVGSEWEISAWNTIQPGRCESAWAGTASASYVVVHVVLGVMDPQGKLGIVKYEFEGGDGRGLTEVQRSKRRDAICGNAGTIRERAGRFMAALRLDYGTGSLDTYKGACRPPLEALPVSAGAILSGNEVYMTVNVAPDEGDYKRIAKLLTPPTAGTPTRETMLSGVVGALQADMKLSAARQFNFRRGPWPNVALERIPEAFDNVIRIFGEEHVLAATAAVVRSDAPVPAPKEFGNWQDILLGQALMNHWASGSPRAFLIGQLRTSPDYESFAYFTNAEARYNYLVSQKGEQAVLAAATRLRDAPKTQFLGSEGVNRSMLSDPGALGCRSNEPLDCIYEMFPDVGRLSGTPQPERPAPPQQTAPVPRRGVK